MKLKNQPLWRAGAEGAGFIIAIFMISDAPSLPLLKSIDKMLGTFYLHQYVFATAVRQTSWNADTSYIILSSSLLENNLVSWHWNSLADQKHIGQRSVAPVPLYVTSLGLYILKYVDSDKNCTNKSFLAIFSVRENIQ